MQVNENIRLTEGNCLSTLKPNRENLLLIQKTTRAM